MHRRLLFLACLAACQPVTSQSAPAPDAPPAEGAASEGLPGLEAAGPVSALPPLAADDAQKAQIAVDPVAPPPPENGSVQLELTPQFAAITDDVAEVNLRVRLTGAVVPGARRPALDLALILDRSGSMRGEKIRSVKAAGLALVDALGPDDRVTLLSYADDVRTHAVMQPVDAEGRERLRAALLAIDSGGGTALGPATFRGLDLLAGQNDGTRTRHVMLLSDGLANVGEQRPEILAARAAAAFRQGISFSTLGVGLDYNEDLMTRLADAGGGRYHFIQSGAAVARVLDDELKGLVATVARQVELDLQLASGTELIRVFGYPVVNDDGRPVVRVGSLGAGQVREVVVRLRLPADRVGSLKLGGVGLRYLDLPADAVQREAQAPIELSRAASADAMRASENAEVSVRVSEVESAELMETAARAVDQGDFEHARGTLKIALDDLRRKDGARPSAALKAQIATMEEADGEVEAARSNESARKTYTKKFKSRAYDSMK